MIMVNKDFRYALNTILQSSHHRSDLLMRMNLYLRLHFDPLSLAGLSCIMHATHRSKYCYHAPCVTLLLADEIMIT